MFTGLNCGRRERARDDESQQPVPSTDPDNSANNKPALAGTHLSLLVSLKRVLRRLFTLLLRLELGQVSVVVTLHLEVEHLAFPGGRRWDQVVV